MAVLAVGVGLVLGGLTRYTGISGVLVRLQDTAQIRVRGAVLLILVFAVLAERLGLEVILGAFVAGREGGGLEEGRGHVPTPAEEPAIEQGGDAPDHQEGDQEDRDPGQAEGSPVSASRSNRRPLATKNTGIRKP